LLARNFAFRQLSFQHVSIRELACSVGPGACPPALPLAVLADLREYHKMILFNSCFPFAAPTCEIPRRGASATPHTAFFSDTWERIRHGICTPPSYGSGFHTRPSMELPVCLAAHDSEFRRWTP
jgi:hypothetical protein